MLELAKYHFDRLEFEESWPLVKKYVETVETRLGKNHVWIVPGLRFQVSLTLTANREAESAAIVKRISEITGQPESGDEKIVDISRRSKDSQVTLRYGLVSRPF